jgi:hypothetical protein
MLGPGSREEWLETVGLAVAAGALYASGFFALLFLVPVAALAKRRGFAALIWAVGIAVAAIVIVDAIRLSRLAGGLGSPWLLAWNWTLPVGLLVGLTILEAPIRQLSRTLYRLLAGWVGTLAVTGPLYVKVARDGTLNAFLERQFGALGMSADAAFMAETAERVLANTYGVGLLVMLLVNWYLGVWLAHRFSTGVPGPPRVDRFVVPPQGIWVLIASAAGVMVSLVTEIAVVEPVAWNLALVALLFYALEGIGVGRYLLRRYQVSQGLRMLIAVGVIVLLFIPGVNLIVLLGLPGLGVSEIWIDYNRFERRR